MFKAIRLCLAGPSAGLFPWLWPTECQANFGPARKEARTFVENTALVGFVLQKPICNSEVTSVYDHGMIM